MASAVRLLEANPSARTPGVPTLTWDAVFEWSLTTPPVAMVTTACADMFAVDGKRPAILGRHTPRVTVEICSDEHPSADEKTPATQTHHGCTVLVYNPSVQAASLVRVAMRVPVSEAEWKKYAFPWDVSGSWMGDKPVTDATAVVCPTSGRVTALEFAWTTTLGVATPDGSGAFRSPAEILSCEIRIDRAPAPHLM
jgi:hypothetical protein